MSLGVAYIGKPHGSEDGNDLGIENRTRLGDEGITVIPLQVVGEAWRMLRWRHPFDPPATHLRHPGPCPVRPAAEDQPQGHRGEPGA